jgi:hypothetical protein
VPSHAIDALQSWLTMRIYGSFTRILLVCLIELGWNLESSRLIPHFWVLVLLVLCLDLIWRQLPLRLRILSTNLIILLATLFYPLLMKHVSLKGKLLHATKENIELQQEVAYLTAQLEKTVLSKKMIEEGLSRVKESAIKSTYRLWVGFERCEDKGEKSVSKFIPSSTYHKEEATIKSTKAHYPSNPKSSFNPKREARKETPKPREEAFVCMFCGRAGHLDEFCFRRKRIKRRRAEYARDSYRDEFLDVPPHSYSHVPPRFYSRVSPRTFSRALPRTSSGALPQFAHGPNHHSYDFGPRENRFEPRRFGYGPRPYRGDRFPRRPDFPAGGSFPHFESRHLDGPRFPHRGSRLTRPSGEVQRTVKTSSSRMVKCWIPKIYLTNPSTEPSTLSRPM